MGKKAKSETGRGHFMDDGSMRLPDPPSSRIFYIAADRIRHASPEPRVPLVPGCYVSETSSVKPPKRPLRSTSDGPFSKRGRPAKTSASNQEQSTQSAATAKLLAADPKEVIMLAKRLHRDSSRPGVVSNAETREVLREVVRLRRNAKLGASQAASLASLLSSRRIRCVMHGADKRRCGCQETEAMEVEGGGKEEEAKEEGDSQEQAGGKEGDAAEKEEAAVEMKGYVDCSAVALLKVIEENKRMQAQREAEAQSFDPPAEGFGPPAAEDKPSKDKEGEEEDGAQKAGGAEGGQEEGAEAPPLQE